MIYVRPKARMQAWSRKAGSWSAVLHGYALCSRERAEVMVKRTVLLHDDDDVANFVNSIAVACILTGCRKDAEREQNRRRSH